MIRIGGDGFLQDFLRMRKKAVMDFSFLDKCFLAIRPETWKRVNELLGRYAVAEEAINPKVIRTDTTVVESNIHHPTDSSLLWDTWRVATRLLKRAREILRALEAAPKQIETLLGQSESLKKLALKYVKADNFFFLSRGYTFPIALEGALKLKEISYIHAEGYSAAEMKHGPIALIDAKTPTVFLVPKDSMYEKTMANLAMIRARKGPVIAVATEGDTQVKDVADDVIYLPATAEPVYPILASVPLQLFAYHIAVARGCDVDKPRNLAKSVTVE